MTHRNNHFLSVIATVHSTNTTIITDQRIDRRHPEPHPRFTCIRRCSDWPVCSSNDLSIRPTTQQQWITLSIPFIEPSVTGLADQDNKLA